MSTKSDRWMSEEAPERGAMEPSGEKQVASGAIFYGFSLLGYGARVCGEFKIFTNVNHTIVDPRAIDERPLVSEQAESAMAPPTGLRWHGLLNTLEFPELYLRSALVSRPMRVAGLVRT